jgi:hypothetical protein
MKSHQKITLDVNKASTYEMLVAHKDDKNSRFIDCTLTDSGNVLALSENITAKYDATVNDVVVADGETADVNTTDNTITVELTENMLSLSGIMKISLKVYEEDSILTAQMFCIKVVNSVINDSSKFEPSQGTIAKRLSAVEKEVSEKSDKATTLDGYGITDGENSSNKVSTRQNVTDTDKSYPSLAYLDNYYYTQDDTDELLGKKADTLTFDSTPTIGSNNPVTSHGVAAALSYKADSKSVTSKADKATTLSGYGITDAYTKDEIEDNYLTIIAGQNINRNIIDLQTKITDLKNGKADKATTLAGYGITDGLSNTAGAVGTDNIADKSITLEKLKDDFCIDREHIDDNAVGADEIAPQEIEKTHLTLALQNEISNKADKATTLAGYGITDAYTKDEIDTTIANKVVKYVGTNDIDDCTQQDVIYRVYTGGSYQTLINVLGTYICSQYLFAQQGGIKFRTRKKSNDEWGDWSDWIAITTEKEIANKYDSSNIESGKGSFTYDESITTLKVNNYNYVKIGSICYLEFEISPTSDLAAESLKLTGLPFVSKSYIKHLCATTESHTAGRACIIASDTITIMAAVKTNARVYGSFFYRI